MVRYVITVRNTGSSKRTKVEITDDLSGVLDDGEYAGGVKATNGTVSVDTSTLTWRGTLKPHQTAVITYPIRLRRTGGDHRLSNVVTAPAHARHLKVSGRLAGGPGRHRCSGTAFARHGHG